MSYIPTIWQDGDILTAEKLNKLENAIAEVQAIYNLMENDPSTLMTGDELYTAIQNNPDKLFYLRGELITDIQYDETQDVYIINNAYYLSANDTTLIYNDVNIQ